MSDALDRPAAVRPGEEIDVARLADFLGRELAVPDGRLEIEQFPNGYSNLTYLLRFAGRDLVLRRPPFGAKIKSAHDMSREYRVLSGLQGLYEKAPRPLVYCDDEAIIGAPFYVMERLSGVILRNRIPSGLNLDPATMSGISCAFVDNLAELHGLELRYSGLEGLGKPDGYVERQVSGWARRYRNAQTDDLPGMIDAAQWLSDNLPLASAAALIHNDYKYDNLVLDPNGLSRIVGVLDWEMATIGDPLMDLGTALGYWIEDEDPMPLKMFGLTWLPGNLTRLQLAERYAEQRGLDDFDPLFYTVFGIFKIGVIVQQIYARFKQGHTSDPRFAGLIEVVRACSQVAIRAMESGRISNLGTK